MERYCQWAGRRCELWHGDVSQAARRKILKDLPDCLLTTPESLEVMLVSAVTDHRFLFGGLRLVVIDEIHSFAGDGDGKNLVGGSQQWRMSQPATLCRNPSEAESQNWGEAKTVPIRGLGIAIRSGLDHAIC